MEFSQVEFRVAVKLPWELCEPSFFCSVLGRVLYFGDASSSEQSMGLCSDLPLTGVLKPLEVALGSKGDGVAKDGESIRELRPSLDGLTRRWARSWNEERGH